VDDLLTVEETAALLHLNIKRVQALARKGQLPAVRSGRRWLFPRTELMQALRTQRSADAPSTTLSASAIDLSARNQLRGRVERLVIEGLMAEVHVAIGNQTLVAMITRSSAERLGLRRGLDVIAVIKSTEVMIGLEAG